MISPKLMQTAGADAYHYPLMIRRLLPPASTCSSEIVSDGRRFTYSQFHDRVHRLASSLRSRGVRPGDVVAVMDWDSHRYLECYFAIPMMGAVLQTVNVRLPSSALAFTLRQSGAVAVLHHLDFGPILAPLLPGLSTIKTIVCFGTAETKDGFEELITEGDTAFAFEDFDEDAIATTFHTSGTTGDPKQVFFTHRQLVLHTLAAATALANQPPGQHLCRTDVYMPITPMFHVHAWGIPYVATMLGIKQVYPGRYDAARLLRLKQDENVSFSHCVPTILRMLIDEARLQEAPPGPWKMIIGGSALPEAMAEEAASIGIEAVAGYGMSETGPIIAMASSFPGDATAARCRAGMPIPLVDVAVDPKRGNELTLRAPWLTQGYATQAASDELWEGGRLHTGDIAALDPDGGIRIVDRLKDVIKTGGEWVSSIEIEDLLMTHADVAEAAVIGVPSERWGERPIAFVVLSSGAKDLTAETLRAEIVRHIECGTVSRYAVPDVIQFMASLPKTSVGKIDKKQLRLASEGQVS